MFVFASLKARELLDGSIHQFPQLRILSLSPGAEDAASASHPVLGVVLAGSDHDATRQLADELVNRALPPSLRTGAIITLAAADCALFPAWLISRQIELINQILSEHAHTQNALAAARIDFQHTQLAFARLEEFLSSLAVPNSWVTYSRECDGAFQQLVADTGKIALVEDAIPHLIKVPAAIALCLRAPRLPGDERLTLELYEFETRRVLAEWTLPLGDIRQGWTVFEVDPEVEHCNYLGYRLRVPNWTHDPVRIGLSQFPQYRLTPALQPGTPLPRAPAVRLYRGLPSRRRTSIAGASLPASASAKPRPGSRAISFEKLREAELVRTHRMPVNWTPLTWLHRENGLMVHPTGPTPTIARIRGIELDGQSSIMAMCTLAHDTAGDVECAVALESLEIATARAAISGFGDISDFSEEALSKLSWVRMKARDYVEIREPITARPGLANLLLLSRSVGEDSNNCQVTFKGIMLY